MMLAWYWRNSRFIAFHRMTSIVLCVCGWSSTEAEAEMLAAAGYDFEPPPIPRTGRLRDVLERMGDAELALQLGELADQERERRRTACLSGG